MDIILEYHSVHLIYFSNLPQQVHIALDLQDLCHDPFPKVFILADILLVLCERPIIHL
jgi:hypothetical protein